MNLTERDMNILATFHGNTVEAREVRAKLRDAGLKYCSPCGRALRLRAFNAMKAGPDGLQGSCRNCMHTNRRANYTPSNRAEAASAHRAALVA